MAVVTAAPAPLEPPEEGRPVDLTDEECTAFLEAFDAAHGNAKGACRALGASRGAVCVRKAVDEVFADRFYEIRRRYSPLSIAGDELFRAIDVMDSMVGGENTLDHLINVAFDPTQEPIEPSWITEEIDGYEGPAALEAARDRVTQAGLGWAVEVVKATGHLDRDVKAALERKLAARRERNLRQREKRAERGDVTVTIDLADVLEGLDMAVDEELIEGREQAGGER
jgi:hypothetical protein